MTGSAYVNDSYTEEYGVPHAYGKTYTRLTQSKAKYDPNNLFRMNQNIKPQQSAST